MASIGVPAALSALTDEDLPYEVQLLREPLAADIWLAYARSKLATDLKGAIAVLWRALHTVKDNALLWETYIDMRIKLVRESATEINATEIQAVLSVFEDAQKALGGTYLFANQHLAFLEIHSSVLDPCTMEASFNFLLKTLPNADHGLVWKRSLELLPVSLKLVQRYWQWAWAATNAGLDPVPWDTLETYERMCKLVSKYNELKTLDSAFQLLKETPTDRYAVHVYRFEAYARVANISSKSSLVKSLKAQFDLLMDQFSDRRADIVRLYADVVRNTQSPSAAFDLFASQLTECSTMAQFGLLFDAYALQLELRCRELVDKKEEGPELDSLLDRLEMLLSKRSLMANDIKLRQDPHNAQHWMDRIAILKQTASRNEVLDCYSKAVLSIDMSSAQHLPVAKLWCRYAMEYVEDAETCANLFEAAMNVAWAGVAPKEYIVAGYANMLVNHRGIHAALLLLNSVLEPRGPVEDVLLPNVTHSATLWAYYADLAQCSNIAETVRVYERTMDLKVASGVTVLNYADFLIGQGLYARAFAVYERGLALFSGDTRWIITGVFLSMVLTHYAKSELGPHEARAVFDTAIENTYNDDRTLQVGLLYVQWELQHGSKVKASSVLERVLRVTQAQDVHFECYKMMTGLAESLRGVESVLLNALDGLSCNTSGFVDDIVTTLVKTEVGLGAPDRARQVLFHAAEACMTFGNTFALRKSLWTVWKQFELEHGNQDSYKEMLKHKRHLEMTGRPEKELLDAPGAGDEVGFVIGKSKHNSNPQIETSTIMSEPINDDAIDLEMDDFA